MELFTIGITHHEAPVSIRERVAFTPESLVAALQDLTALPGVKEGVIVSTCNRTEIYCTADHPEVVEQWLAAWHTIPLQELAPHIFRHRRHDAIRHVFRVACGLDSMVLGETQIQGQVKDAMQTALRAGTLGTVLNKLLQTTFAVAKEVRTSTDIGASSVSMAAACVRLAERIFPSVAGQSVLFVGAGDMIALCASHFAAQKPKLMTIANRTRPRAEALARRFDARVISLSDIPERLAEHDIVITSTASPLPIIGLGIVERAVRARRHQPMFMVDLAVPRDIETEVSQLPDVYLYTVDELSGIIHAGRAAREEAALAAETLVDSRVHDFIDWLERREVVPTIVALREHAERMRLEEMQRAERRLAAGEDPHKVMEQLSVALTNKFLHVPNHALNHISGNDRAELIAWLQRLYPTHHDKE